MHELEIEKVEMQSDAVLKEHEVKRRDLLILKYDKQRTLCDEIIQRQQKLIEGEGGRILPLLFALLYSCRESDQPSFPILMFLCYSNGHKQASGRR